MTPIHMVTQGARLLLWCSYIIDEGEKVWGRQAVYSCILAIHHFHSYPTDCTSHTANQLQRRLGNVGSSWILISRAVTATIIILLILPLKKQRFRRMETSPKIWQLMHVGDKLNQGSACLHTTPLNIACLHLRVPRAQKLGPHRG